MLIPGRLKLVIGAAVTAIACLASLSRADTKPPKTPPQPVEQPTSDFHATVRDLMEVLKSEDPNRELEGDLKLIVESGAGHRDEFTGTAHGASARAYGDHKAPANLTGTTPAVNVPGGGGTTPADFNGGGSPENSGSAAWWRSPWFWCGVALELIAGGIVVAPMIWPLLLPVGVKIGAKVPLGLAAAGGACIFAAFQPVMATIGGIVAVGVLVVPKLITEWQRIKATGQANASRAQGAAEVTSIENENAANVSALDELAEAVHASGSLKAVDEHMKSRADDPDYNRVLAALRRNAPRVV